MMTAEDYVNRVRDELPRGMPTRAQIATELRAHIAERVAEGRPLDDVLRQLGDPVTLAESYLSAETLEAAPFSRRAVAKLIDALAVLAFIVPLALLTSRGAQPEAAFTVLVIVVLLCGSFLLGAYTVIAEFSSGQTLGKRARRIRVLRETGRPISFGQSVVRQLPILLSVYWIDAMFALFTEKRQRAFELLSKTRVVLASPEEAR